MLAAKYETEILRALKVMDDLFCSFPIGLAKAVQEVTQVIDCKNNIQLGAN